MNSGLCRFQVSHFWVAMMSGMTEICLLPSSSFRRRPESSGLYNTFPPNGNDHLWIIPASVTGAICLTPRPALLGGLFQTPLYHLGRLFPTRLYHLHPCRRASMQAWIPAFAEMTTGQNQRLKRP